MVNIRERPRSGVNSSKDSSPFPWPYGPRAARPTRPTGLSERPLHSSAGLDERAQTMV